MLSKTANGFGGFVMNTQLLYFTALFMQGKKDLFVYISLRMYTKKTMIHNSSFKTQFLYVDLMCTTCFGSTFGYHQVLHEKHLEEEYCCRVIVSSVKNLIFLPISF